MDFSGWKILVTGVYDCPYYQADDHFELTGRAIALAEETAFCMTFAADLVNVLPNVAAGGAMAVEFACTGGDNGCAGQLDYRIEKAPEAFKSTSAASEKNLEAISKLLLNLPMFASFDRTSIRRMLNHFKLKSLQDLQFESRRIGEVIIAKGQPGTHLHIIIAGRVEVIDEDGNAITSLERGDVFGEMSLISGNPVGATIRAGTPTTVLRLPGKDLNKLLPRYPSLQQYFTRLLTQRLTRTNTERSQDLSSGMTGRLSEVPPEELLQTMNLNRKTGVLNFQLPPGPGAVFFKNGDIIHAEFADLNGQKAVIAIVKNRTGKFAFNPGLPAEAADMRAIGNFMGMLMNALKEMDEGREEV